MRRTGICASPACPAFVTTPFALPVIFAVRSLGPGRCGLGAVTRPPRLPTAGAAPIANERMGPPMAELSRHRPVPGPVSDPFLRAAKRNPETADDVVGTETSDLGDEFEGAPIAGPLAPAHAKHKEGGG